VTCVAKASDLAARINAAHDEAFRSALDAAVLCGRLLLEAKQRLGHGAWAKWVEANLRFGDRQARRYMQIAMRVDELPNRTFESDSTLAAVSVRSPPCRMSNLLPPSTRPRAPSTSPRSRPQLAKEGAAEVGSVVLERIGPVTHNWDWGNRYVKLWSKRVGNHVLASAPAVPGLAVAGYYMLFAGTGA
jgi:hypothetical protein